MNSRMTALAKIRPEAGLCWIEAPAPEPGPDDVLIKVRRTAICGTDLHIWRWDEWAARTVPVPMIVGHEFAGEIIEVGSRVTRQRRPGSASRPRGTSSTSIQSRPAPGATISIPTPAASA